MLVVGLIVGPGLNAGSGSTIAIPPPAANEHAGSSSEPAGVTDTPAAVPDRRAAHGNLVGHGGPVKAITVNRKNSQVLTGSFDYAMMVWDVSGDTPVELRRLAEHEGAVNAVAFVGAGRRALAAGDDGVLVLWDIESGTQLHRFIGHTAKVVGIAVSPDARWAATASWDHTARLWDLERLEPGPVLQDHRGPVNDVEFSADGNAVYTASNDGEIHLFASVDGSHKRPLYRHGWGINVLSRIPDTDNLVFGAINGTAAVVSATSGNIVTELKSYDRPVLSVAVTDKPGYVATGGAEGTVRVYRSADFALIEEYQNPYGPIWAMDFAPDGKSMLLGGLDDFVTAWQITPRQPFEAIDSPFPRRFQLSEAGDDPLARGRIHFARKCSVCHTLVPDGGNRAGPTLHGIFGRKIATVPGYPYSQPLKHLDIVWSEDTIGKLFELGPDIFTPGSKMPLQKMTDPEQRDDLIAYLKEATRLDAPDEAEHDGSQRPGGTKNELEGTRP